MFPDGVDLHVEIETADLAQAARHSLEAIEAAGLPPLAEWSIPVASRARKKGLDEALAKLAGTDEAGRASTSLGFELAQGWTGAIHQPHQRPGLRELVLIGNLDRARPDLPALVGALAAVCRELFERAPVRAAYTRWVGRGALCTVELPIARMRTQVVVTSTQEVEAAYARPAAFWSAWETRTDRGDRVLLTRAVDARDSVELLERLIDPQWEMARAAKPKQGLYPDPRVEPEERPRYLAAESPFEEVGYIADQKLFEMSCVLAPGAHVPGWQIHTLMQRLRSGQLADGRPLETVRVVFFDRASAEQEKRPLLDVGVRVYWQDASGDMVAVGE